MKCIDCNEINPTAFNKGKTSYCKRCHYARSSKWRKENPEKMKKLVTDWKLANPGTEKVYKQNRLKKQPDAYHLTNLKWKFGVSSERYYELLQEQEGKCAICRGDNNGKRLALDHDHATGSIRQLLCRHCNLALGYIKDNPSIAEEMAKYLRKHLNLS